MKKKIRIGSVVQLESFYSWGECIGSVVQIYDKDIFVYLLDTCDKNYLSDSYIIGGSLSFDYLEGWRFEQSQILKVLEY